jgi:hypothetical protein
MTLQEIEKLCDFYVIELYDCLLFNDNFVIPKNTVHGLKHTEVTPEDFDSIAKFGKIIKNYYAMMKIKDDTYCHYSGLPSPLAYLDRT